MKINFKFLIVLSIFFVGCICVSSTFAADISVNDDFSSVDNTSVQIQDDLNHNGVNNLNDEFMGSFSDLNNVISGKTGIIDLDMNYTYDKNNDSELLSGITISSDNVVIDGHGCVINGSDLARVFNITGTNVTIKNINFINTNSSDDGGAIYWSGADGSVTGCNFTNTTSSSYSGGGGAIFWSGANGVVSGCAFSNSSASEYGGAIYWSGANGTVSGCSFTNCFIEVSGGAIYWSGANGTVSGCAFSNTNSLSWAGAIIWSGANGTVSGCSFTNCSAKDWTGGAIMWCVRDYGTVSDCTFTNCCAVAGDAIHWESSNCVVSGCTFTNCCAGGGAIFCESSNGVVSDCTFINSFASDGGGAIYWSGANGTVSGCTFINSSASEYGGGAIYWKNSADGVVSGCTFINSFTSSSGGAIYWKDSADGVVSGCTFINSSASEYGGAIFWSGANGTVSGCNFTNIVSSSGGAIFWFGADGVVSGCTFINSSATKGNVIYICSGCSLNITDCSCNSTDDKAPIYNDGGTILSDVVITTMDGETKEVINGKTVNLTGIIITSGMHVAGGTLTFTINGANLNASSDDNGLYSTEYTVDFVGTNPVNATYNNSIEELQSLIAGNIVAKAISSTKVNGDKNNSVSTQTNFTVEELPVAVSKTLPNTGNPIIVLLITLCAIGLESFRRKF